MIARGGRRPANAAGRFAPRRGIAVALAGSNYQEDNPMLRLLIAAAFVTTAVSGTAHAEVAGRPGTVTAYELDGRTVIDVKPCFHTTRYGGWDYARCGERLRDRLKIEMCRAKGPGTHHYLYQVGDARPFRMSVYCRRY
jgi:hypothetical protein